MNDCKPTPAPPTVETRKEILEEPPRWSLQLTATYVERQRAFAQIIQPVSKRSQLPSSDMLITQKSTEKPSSMMNPRMMTKPQRTHRNMIMDL